MNIQAILIQEKCIVALKGEASMHVHLSKAKKIEMVDKDKSVIILCIRDKILKEVTRKKNVASMWAKHESVYITKSLAHNLCFKQQLYSF